MLASSASLSVLLIISIKVCLSFHLINHGNIRYSNQFVRPKTFFGTSTITSSSSSSSRSSTSLSEQIQSHDNLWKSAIGVHSDLNYAVQEALDSILVTSNNNSNSNRDDHNATLAIVFVSSIYEASAFSYNIILDNIKMKLPSIKHVIGCTTGCPIGGYQPFTPPIEMESRASISILLANLDDHDIQSSLFNMSTESIKEYINQSSTLTSIQSTSSSTPSSIKPTLSTTPFKAIRVTPNKSIKDNVMHLSSSSSAVSLIFATESTKSNLAEFLTAFEDNEDVQSVGAVASSVTTLHTPKVFMSSWDADDNKMGLEWNRYTTG
jgi:hypothetical protein